MYNYLTGYGWQSGKTMMTKIRIRYLTKVTETHAAMEPIKQKSLEFTADDIMPVSVVHARATSHAETIPLIESTDPEISPNIFDITEKKGDNIVSVKSPLAFDEIPGPAVLKIWEKYWKYVPILGTQLVYSLLINNFTQGRLTWNRNITPLNYLFNEYGPIVRINGPMMDDIVMIHRPEHIAEVLKQEGNSPMRSGIDILQHYRTNYRKYRLPGPFSMQGDEWLETKAKLEKPLAEQISTYLSRIDMISDEFAQRIKTIRNRQDEVSGYFDKELSRWGMECFSTLMFNKRLGFFDKTGLNSLSEPSKIIDALITAHVYLSKCETGFQVWRFIETPYSRKLFEACDIIDALTNKYIRQAQNQLTNRSSTSGEIQNVDARGSSAILEKLLMNQRMHPDDISALLMDMIILGVQATVNSEAFLLYFLAKNPRIQRKLYEEVSLALPTRESSLTEESLEKMTYLKACLQECLRLRPAFPYISRLLPKTITLHGYTIPKGTYVIMANEISSRKEENFEDPEKFRPERWFDEQLDDHSWQKFSCLPFGHGMRSCLGKNIAEKQMMLLTAKLIRSFRIEYDYADIQSKYLMVNVPNRPLRFRFVDRL